MYTEYVYIHFPPYVYMSFGISQFVFIVVIIYHEAGGQTAWVLQRSEDNSLLKFLIE